MQGSNSQSGASSDARSAGVKQKKACSHEHGCNSLLDLPESLIVITLRLLPTKVKCQAESVCRTFRKVLRKPTQGDVVWGALNLRDPLFLKLSLYALNRQNF